MISDEAGSATQEHVLEIFCGVAKAMGFKEAGAVISATATFFAKQLSMMAPEDRTEILGEVAKVAESYAKKRENESK